MTANELRIGNYVDIISRGGRVRMPIGSVRKIGQIEFFDVHLYDYKSPFATQEAPEPTPISDLSPIPITEEWLIKFGFVLSYTGSDFKRYNKKGFDQLADYGGQSIVLKSGVAAYMECGYYDNVIDCEHVHQLQNLFFCLVGEELQIKE